MVSTWIIGCIINLCGSIVINVGTNLVKYHHTLMTRAAYRAYLDQLERHQSHAEWERVRKSSSASTTSSLSSVAPPSLPRHFYSSKSTASLGPASAHTMNGNSAPSVESGNNSAEPDPHSNNSTPVFNSQSQLLSPSPRSLPSILSSNPYEAVNGNSDTPPPQIAPTPLYRSASAQTPGQYLYSPSTSSNPHQRVSLSSPSQALMNDKSIWWYTGFFLFALGNIANFISFSFTAQSLLAGLGSIQFISNVICSALIMNHPITLRILLATLAIVTGNLFIVFFASKDSASLTVEELWLLYVDNEAYQIYCIVMSLVVLILFIYYRQTKNMLKQSLPRGSRLSIHHYRLLPFIPFSYAAISAIIGSQSVLLAKSLSELIRTTLGKINQFTSAFTYFIVLAWALSTAFWLYRMNAALRKFDGVFIIPVLQVVWTLFSIVGGGIYFKEFRSLGISEVIFFTIGVLIVMIGVYLLSPQIQTTNKERKGTEEEREREGIRRESNSDQIHAIPLTNHFEYAHNNNNNNNNNINTNNTTIRSDSIGDRDDITIPPTENNPQSNQTTLTSHLTFTSRISSNNNNTTNNNTNIATSQTVPFVHPLQIRQILQGKVHPYTVIGGEGRGEGSASGSASSNTAINTRGESGRSHSFSFSSSASSDGEGEGDIREREMAADEESHRQLLPPHEVRQTEQNNSRIDSSSLHPASAGSMTSISLSSARSSTMSSAVPTAASTPTITPRLNGVAISRSLSLGDRTFNNGVWLGSTASGTGTGSRIFPLPDDSDGVSTLDRPGAGLGDTPTSASSTRSLMSEEWRERRRPRALSFGISMPWALDSDDD